MINIHGFGDVFQTFTAESVEAIAIPKAAYCLRTDQELAGLGDTGQACRKIRHRTTGREGPARAVQPLEASRADRGGARVEAHVDGERLFAVCLVERFGRARVRLGRCHSRAWRVRGRSAS